MTRVMASDVPVYSEIAHRLEGATFYDCYDVAVADPDASALTHYLRMVAKTPAWVNTLMTLRNRTVAWFGLKHLGHLGDVDAAKPVNAYAVGDRVGIFSIRYLTGDEVILGDTDKHLGVELSVCKTMAHARDHIAVTTVVRNHNALGKIYMGFVAPVHRKIVPAMLRRLASA